VDEIDVDAPKVHLASSSQVAGSQTEVTWDVPDSPAPSVTLMSSFDGGATWNIVAEGVPNTGDYTWTVPHLTSNDAQLAVVEIYATDETGIVTESEWATSDPFSISSTLGVGTGSTALALRPANPTVGPLSVSFSLATGTPATLEAFDVGGRRAASRDVGTSGPGWHWASLGRLPAGVYVVRLTQAGHSRSAHVVVVR